MRKPTIFDYQAQVGLTKHMGGHDSTQALIEACQISSEQHVLEIGCGVGTSAVYLAGEVGCRVTGVDISERMIQRSRERAKAKNMEHLTTFRTADMNKLPFDSDTFDVVIGESVLAFSKEKPKAVSEMKRVTRPGGFVGLNESVWLHEPTEEWIEWFAQDAAANASTLSAEGYAQLLEGAGLELVSKQVHRITMKSETRGLVKRYGWSGLLKSTLRGLAMYLQRSDYRQFVAGIQKSGITPGDPQDHIGYGILIAKKNVTN
jgi:ubiquinone/menaquinone biosynthesis C-methylase UbiE